MLTVFLSHSTFVACTATMPKFFFSINHFNWYCLLLLSRPRTLSVTTHRGVAKSGRHECESTPTMASFPARNCLDASAETWYWGTLPGTSPAVESSTERESEADQNTAAYTSLFFPVVTFHSRAPTDSAAGHMVRPPPSRDLFGIHHVA